MKLVVSVILLAAFAGCDNRSAEAPPEGQSLAARLAWCRVTSARGRMDFCLDAEREEERRFVGRAGKSVADSFDWGASAVGTGRGSIVPVPKALP